MPRDWDEWIAVTAAAGYVGVLCYLTFVLTAASHGG